MSSYEEASDSRDKQDYITLLAMTIRRISLVADAVEKSNVAMDLWAAMNGLQDMCPLIQGVKGELYPCKPDIFTATYDPLIPTACDEEEGKLP